DLFGDRAEILGDERKNIDAELFAQRRKELSPRSFPPRPFHCRRRLRRDLPVANEADEVVQPQQVESFQRTADARAPEGEAVLFHPLPPVERIAPARSEEHTSELQSREIS